MVNAIMMISSRSAAQNMNQTIQAKDSDVDNFNCFMNKGCGAMRKSNKDPQSLDIESFKEELKDFLDRLMPMLKAFARLLDKMANQQQSMGCNPFQAPGDVGGDGGKSINAPGDVGGDGGEKTSNPTNTPTAGDPAQDKNKSAVNQKYWQTLSDGGLKYIGDKNYHGQQPPEDSGFNVTMSGYKPGQKVELGIIGKKDQGKGHRWDEANDSYISINGGKNTKGVNRSSVKGELALEKSHHKFSKPEAIADENGQVQIKVSPRSQDHTIYPKEFTAKVDGKEVNPQISVGTKGGTPVDDTAPITGSNDNSNAGGSKIGGGGKIDSFDKEKDLEEHHYDLKSDPDDIQAIGRAGMDIRNPALKGTNHRGVIGAVGNQGGKYIDGIEGLANKAFGADNVSDASKNWDKAVDESADAWKKTFDGGGKVHVSEGGQSDFTADVLSKVRADGYETKGRVRVVQHSHGNNFNEKHSSKDDIAYIEKHAQFDRIENGNPKLARKNGTAIHEKLKCSSNPEIAELATMSEHLYKEAQNRPGVWKNPKGLDPSDVTETHYIQGLNINNPQQHLEFSLGGGSEYVQAAPSGAGDGSKPSSTGYAAETGTASANDVSATTGVGGTPAPASDPTNKKGWKFNSAFSDEFSGSSLDKTKWHDHHTYWKGRDSTFSPNNVQVDDGKLKLDFKKEALGGEEFSASALQSINKAPYGYYEVSAKVADASHTSSFWLQGKKTEIDVMEAIGNSSKLGPSKDSQMPMNTHFFPNGTGAGNSQSNPESIDTGTRLADDFHKFGIEWDKDKIKWYFDGKLVRTTPNKNLHEDMHLFLDTEIFKWAGKPGADFKKSTFEVDYIRAWTADPNKAG